MKPLGPDDPVVVTFSRELPEEAPDIAIGPPYDTRLVIRDVGLFLRLRENHPVVEVGAFAHQLSVVLTNRWWRTFGATDELLGEGIRFDLDLDIAYIEGEGEGTGLQLNLGAGLDVTFDIGWKLGDRPPAANADDPKGQARLLRPQAPQHPALPADRGHGGELRRSCRGPLPRLDAARPGRPRGRRPRRLGGLVGRGHPAGEGVDRLPPPTGAGVQIQRPGIVGGGFLDFTGGPERALRRPPVPADQHVRGHGVRHPRADGPAGRRRPEDVVHRGDRHPVLARHPARLRVRPHRRSAGWSASTGEPTPTHSASA